MTSENPTAERITNSLFQRLSREKAKDKAALRCPLCRDLLESLMLDKNADGCQKIWWMCKNTMEQKCTFPMDIPPNVFWVERTPEQTIDGFIPRPRLDLLPPQYRYLYPDFFPDSAQNSPLTSRPTSSVSWVDSTASLSSLHTRDMSLNSALASVITPQTTSCSDSVIICESSEQGGTKSGSCNQTTSKSSDGFEPSNQLARVPAVAAQSRKRAATDESPAACIGSVQALKNHVAELKEQGVQDEEMRIIAEKGLSLAKPTPAKKKNYAPYESIDAYTDSIVQSVPQLTHAEAQSILAKKTRVDRMSMVFSLRKAPSGVSLLQVLGAGGKPPPENNDWREKTRDQVNATLNKTMRQKSEMQKRLQAAARSSAAASRERRVAPARPAVQPAPSTSTEVAASDDDREVEYKTNALIKGKMHAQLEKRRQILLEKVARLEQRGVSRGSGSVRTVTPQPAPVVSCEPIHDPYADPIFDDYFPAAEQNAPSSPGEHNEPSFSGEINDEHYQDLFGDYDITPLY